MNSGHVVAIKIYTAVFFALIGLTGITTAVAFVDLGGGLNAAVAFAIALCKALLVILYFMHVRYGTRLIWVVLGGGFFWLGILMALSLSDYLTRGWPGLPGE